MKSKHSFKKLVDIIKSSLSFIKDKTFMYQDHYLLKRSTNISETLKKSPDINLKVFSCLQELEDIINEGYILDNFFKLSDFERKFAEGQILFGIFINKNLVHTSWVVLKDNTCIHPPLKINYITESYVHYCITHPNYRGKGLYPYALQEICNFLQKEGKSKAKMSIEKKNLSSLKGAKRSNFIIYGEGKYLKLLNFTYWKENY